MRVAIGAAAAALAMMAGAAHARVYQPSEVYGAYCGAPPTREVNRAYDWALNHYRTRGAWLDGGEHAGWTRGQRVSDDVARNAPTIDWCEAHLATPKTNTRWVRVGDDYLEISRYTGRIETVALAYARQGYISAGSAKAAAKRVKPQYVRVISKPKPKIVNYEK